MRAGLPDTYKVFFSKKRPVASAQPAGSILFYPENPTWNDFGFQVRANLMVKPHDAGEVLTLGAFVLPLEARDGSAVAESFAHWVGGLKPIAGTSLLAPPKSESFAFLSLLADDSDYRKLAYWAPSLEVRMAVLFAANDINLARVHKSIPDETIRLATETDAFTSGVMRSSAAYRANWKGARYVSREVPPWIEDSRRDFDVHAQLEGFEAPHVVPFKFGMAKTTLVSDRIHVLIGKNGTGKTQLLNQIIGSIAVRAEDSDQAVFLDRPNADYEVDAAPVAEIPNAVLVFSFDAGDPFPEQTRLGTPLDYSYVNLAATATEDESDTPKYSLGEALRNLIRDDVQLQGKTRFQIFLDVIGPVLEVSLLHIPVNAKSRGTRKLSNVFIDSSERGWLSLAKVPRGEQLILHLASAIDTSRDLAFIDASGREFPPSSGQRVYLQFAAKALSVIAQGSLIVLDEPETHLHPNFISEFMTLLHKILEETNSIALIATHSPYVVREVPSPCVHVVEVNERVPTIAGVHLKTLGASVSSISDAVFSDATATRFHRSIAAELAKQAAEQLGTEAQRVAWVVKTFGEELNTEMLSTIRFLMKHGPGPKPSN